VSHGHRPNKGLRIIIADDHPVVLTGIEMVLSSFADFTCSVVARAENADELIHHLHHTPCDLVISDYAMPYGRLPDGLALMGYLKRRFASLPVIVITMLRNPALLQVQPMAQHCRAPCRSARSKDLGRLSAGFSKRDTVKVDRCCAFFGTGRHL
jgi:CheY-like chemotaxis protein